MIHAAVGVPDEGIEIGDVDLPDTLLDEAPQSVRESRAFAAAVRDCGTAAGKEPRWLAVRVLAHISPGDEDVQALLPVIAEIVITSDDIGVYTETLTVAMTVLRDWATTDRKSVLAASPTETGTRVVTAVATTITSNDAEVGQAGAAAATHSPSSGQRRSLLW